MNVGDTVTDRGQTVHVVRISGNDIYLNTKTDGSGKGWKVGRAVYRSLAANAPAPDVKPAPAPEPNEQPEQPEES